MILNKIKNLEHNIKINSDYEAYAKILEKVENLWENIKKKDQLNIEQSILETIAISLHALNKLKTHF